MNKLTVAFQNVVNAPKWQVKCNVSYNILFCMTDVKVKSQLCLTDCFKCCYCKSVKSNVLTVSNE
jgi:hypothetical protein